MKKTALLISLFLLLLKANAQQNDLSGYIVDLKGDTDRVVFKDEVEGKYRDRVMVLRNGSYQEYGPDAIRGFGVPAKFHFRRVRYTNPLLENQVSSHFAKVLFDGVQKLYSFLESDNLFFVYQNRDTSCLLYNDQKQNAGELIASGNYRNQLYFFGRNCPAAAKEAERLGYGESALTNYTASIEKCQGSFDAGQVLFRKEKAISQWNVYGAGMAFGGKSDLLFQVTQRRIFAGKSRSTSLNYGLLVSYNTSNQVFNSLTATGLEYQRKSLVAMIPVYIQYNIGSGPVQPFLYGGIGVAYLQQTELVDPAYMGTENKGKAGVGLMLGAGLECRLNANWWIKADCHFDLLFHLPVVGIMYKF